MVNLETPIALSTLATNSCTWLQKIKQMTHEFFSEKNQSYKRWYQLVTQIEHSKSSLNVLRLWWRFNIKLSYYEYRNSHYKDTTVLSFEWKFLYFKRYFFILNQSEVALILWYTPYAYPWSEPSTSSWEWHRSEILDSYAHNNQCHINIKLCNIDSTYKSPWVSRS